VSAAREVEKSILFLQQQPKRVSQTPQNGSPSPLVWVWEMKENGISRKFKLSQERHENLVRFQQSCGLLCFSVR
jgi:hypothetical protein